MIINDSLNLQFRFQINCHLKMKTNNNHHKINDKPIKYKQFMQELQNSSRSSNHDQSILSQRSFRQNNTLRQQKQINKNQKNKNKQKTGPETIDQIQKSTYKLNKPNINPDQKQNILYTFCDAKNTQKSVQIQTDKVQNKKISQQNTNRISIMDKKYFKTNKTKNEQKQNINFVNKIIDKVEAGFQGKVLKTQTEVLQNLESRKNSIEKSYFDQNSAQPSMTSSIKVQSQLNSNTNRKIQSVKKIFVLSRPSNSQTSKKRKNSNQRSKQSSLNKKQSHQTNQQFSSNKNQNLQQCSSKKKIVSLNINSFKNYNISSINMNKVKLKLSLDKSCQSKRSFRDVHRTLNNSLEKMPSLQQSKIQSLHSQNQKNQFLFSGTELKQFSGLFGKKQFQKQKQQQIIRLQNLIYQYKQREKKLIDQLNIQKQKQHIPSIKPDQKQLQILKKDCSRLTNSYKQIKKLYQHTIQQKQQIQQKLYLIQNQNNDLKQCLFYKKQEVNRLENKITQMEQKIIKLEEDKEKYSLNDQLYGLSSMIKEKISQYQSEISSIMKQNEKLILIREKLENYNMTLKQQIQEKDNLIYELERQQKDINIMRRSCRDEVLDYRQNQNRLSKIVKQLESKLKLANIHNQYLTKQLVTIKNQRKAHTPVGGSSPLLMKFGSTNTLANTITTRNSSICHGRQRIDLLMANNIIGKTQQLHEDQLNRNF